MEQQYPIRPGDGGVVHKSRHLAVFLHCSNCFKALCIFKIHTESKLLRYQILGIFSQFFFKRFYVSIYLYLSILSISYKELDLSSQGFGTHSAFLQWDYEPIIDVT